MKLNIGCGEFYADGWTNMDVTRNSRVRPDIVGSFTHLPDKVKNVTHVYMGHVLEHVDVAEVVRGLRKLWLRCAPNCHVAVVCPDGVRAWDMFFSGRLSEMEAIDAVVGGKRWAHDDHKWFVTEQRLVQVLGTSGLLTSRAVPIDSHVLDSFPVTSRAAWQCAVVGRVSALTTERSESLPVN